MLAVLMLRGPQTPGELKGRTERLEGFADLAAVQEVLERLIEPRLRRSAIPADPARRRTASSRCWAATTRSSWSVPRNRPLLKTGAPRLRASGGRGGESGAARSARSRPARPQRRDRAPARGARRLAPRRPPRGGRFQRQADRPLAAGDRGDQLGPQLAPFLQQFAAAGRERQHEAVPGRTLQVEGALGRASGSRRGSAALGGGAASPPCRWCGGRGGRGIRSRRGIRR